MADKKKCSAIVAEQREISPGIFDLWLECSLAEDALCGQFVGVYPKDKSLLLPRPISICEVKKEEKLLRLVYRVAGEGTKEFSALKKGDAVFLLGVLGNGFPIKEGEKKKALLVGGGIGVPPILQLAKELQAENNIILGYRDGNLFLKEDMEAYGKTFVATEDGSCGTKGNVLNVILEHELEADIIYACGPLPMLKALKEYALKKDIPAYLSLEERMACGVGACLGCVCKTTKKDHHSHVNNARICTDGPVFEAREIDI